MAFTAQDVKTLREMTNVGMMDCKKALQATDGDMDKAVDWLGANVRAQEACGTGQQIYTVVVHGNPILS